MASLDPPTAENIRRRVKVTIQQAKDLRDIARWSGFVDPFVEVIVAGIRFETQTTKRIKGSDVVLWDEIFEAEYSTEPLKIFFSVVDRNYYHKNKKIGDASFVCYRTNNSAKVEFVKLDLKLKVKKLFGKEEEVNSGTLECKVEWGIDADILSSEKEKFWDRIQKEYKGGSAPTSYDPLLSVWQKVKLKDPVDLDCIKFKDQVGRITQVLPLNQVFVHFDGLGDWTGSLAKIHVIPGSHNRYSTMVNEGPFKKGEEIFVIQTEKHPKRGINLQFANFQGRNWWMFLDLEGKFYKKVVHEQDPNVSTKSKSSIQGIPLMLDSQKSLRSSGVSSKSDGSHPSRFTRVGAMQQRRATVTASEAAPDFFTSPTEWWDFWDLDKNGEWSLDEAMEALTVTFHLGKTQQGALKKMLQDSWRFPLQRDDGLSLGQLRAGNPAMVVNVKSCPTLDGWDEEALVRVIGYQESLIIVEDDSNRVAAIPRHLIVALEELSPGNHPEGTIVISGAGGLGGKCNGTYGPTPDRQHKEKPLYKNRAGSIIYWSGFWKMNVIDNAGGWFYSVHLSTGPEPPTGQWTVYGYTGGKANPPPKVEKSTADSGEAGNDMGEALRASVFAREMDGLPTFSVTDKVELASGYEHIEDASGGILDKGDLGVVTRVETCKKPYLVQNLTRQGGNSWWYSSAALMKPTEETLKKYEKEKKLMTASGRKRKVPETFIDWTRAQFLNSSDEGDPDTAMELTERKEVNEFEKQCIKQCEYEIDRLRKANGWPSIHEKPKPPQGVPTLNIHRPDADEAEGRGLKIFLNTFSQIGTKDGDFWQRGYTIKFEQDSGVDWGAVTKVWCNLMTADIFRVDTGLFVPGTVPGAEVRDLSTRGYLMPDWASEKVGRSSAFCRVQYEFVGRFLAYCLYQHCRVEAHLSGYIYRCFLEPGQDFTGPKWKTGRQALADLRTVDHVKAKAMTDVLDWENPDEVEDIFCLDWTVEYYFMGETIGHNLCPNGADTPVTGDNRDAYCLALCNYLLKKSVAVNLSSLVRGFLSVIPRDCLSSLTPKLLEGILVGQPDIKDSDWEDLKKCVVVTNNDGGVGQERVVGHFFEILKEMEPKMRTDFLNFWTGTPRIPAAGFGSIYPPIALALTSASQSNRLPQTHVCFNRLDVPLYPTRELLKEKLLKAVQLTGEAVAIE
eukprot:GEMP01002526.1.p1 GENE.GEMP01002526.1~~GEMP01002526.1.p1  ORF type:complete len:1175 (+),score=189.51 GEMP01002526.1:145-3669(+)